MFVRLLIGREAGRVLDLPYHAATAGFAAGTCQAVTDLEMQEAGVTSGNVSEVKPDAPPKGYNITVREDGAGYDVAGPDGVTLNTAPLRNVAAGRSMASDDFANRARVLEEGLPMAVTTEPDPAPAKPAPHRATARTR